MCARNDRAGIDETERRSPYEELAHLPPSPRSLPVDLCALTPAMERAIRAIHDQDVRLLEGLLDAVVAEVDSPGRRTRLALDVLGFRDQGRSRPELAAAAVLGLDREESILFRCAVCRLLEDTALDPGAPSPDVNPTPWPGRRRARADPASDDTRVSARRRRSALGGDVHRQLEDHTADQLDAHAVLAHCLDRLL